MSFAPSFTCSSWGTAVNLSSVSYPQLTFSACQISGDPSHRCAGSDMNGWRSQRGW